MRFVLIIVSGSLLLSLVDETHAQPLKKSASVNNDLFGVALTTPLPLLYLEQESVRGELKLTKEQIDKLDAIGKSWQAKATKQNLEGGDNPARTDLMGGFAKQIDKVISTEQKTRLNQIILRHREREYGLPAVLGSIVRDLNLSPKQSADFDRLRIQRAEAVLEHLTSGERANAIHRKVHETNLEYVERVDQLLDKEQQAKLKLLLGEPFAGELRLREPLFVTTQWVPPVYLDKLFGFYALEAELLNNESVQVELKLPNDQVRKVREFYVEWSDKLEKRIQAGGDPIDAILNLHDFVGENIGTLLVGKPFEQFRALAMQYRAKIAGPAALFGYPGTGDFLGISGDDLKRVKQTGSLSDLRIPTQIKYKSLFDAPFKGEITLKKNWLIVDRSAASKIQKPTPGDVFVDEKQITFANYMLDKSKRLRLTEDQEKRLREVAEDAPKIRQILHKELSNLPPPTIQGSARTMIPEVRAYEQLRKSIFNQCFEVLDKQQQSLLRGELNKGYPPRYWFSDP